MQGDINHLYGNELEKEICFISEFFLCSFPLALSDKNCASLKPSHVQQWRM
jgi:hypothetical protein